MTKKIPVSVLYAQTKRMLAERWGYIWGMAGVRWTQQKQNAATNEMAVKYGSRWIDHMVADCSGVMVYIWKQQGLSIPHGSNAIARKYVGAMSKTPQPGYAAFKHRSQDTDKYPDGKGDYYHIGIVGEDGVTVYEAKGTKEGFTTSPVKSWAFFAPFKDVEYTREEKPTMDKAIYRARVKVDADSWLNLRAEPKVTSKVVAKIPAGTIVEVLEETNDKWLKVRYDEFYQFHDGYCYAQYLEKIEPVEEDQPTEAYRLALIDAEGNKFYPVLPCRIEFEPITA